MTEFTKPSALLKVYRPIPLRLRLFFHLRIAFTPYVEMANEVPSRGEILDLGCGHGFLSRWLAQAPGRSILGLDHDPIRIELAKRAAEGLSNLKYCVGDARSLPTEQQFDAILAIDFFHYFSRDEQVQMLRDLIRRLRPGGTLLFREINPDGGIAARINRAYEWCATRLGFTRSERKSSITLRTPTEWQCLVEDLGLQVRYRPCTHFLFSDVLFVGSKQGGS